MVRSKDLSSSSKSLTLIAFVLAISALYFGRQIFIPLALGLVFSFLLTPAVTQLEKLRLGRTPSVLIVLVLSFALVCVMSWGVAGQFVEIMANISDYKENLDAKIQLLHLSRDGNLGKATATFKDLNKELSAVSGQIAANQAKEPGRPVRPLPVQLSGPPSNLLQDLRALLGPLAGILETAVIVIIFTVFMLLKREDLRNRAIRLAGRGQLTRMTQALDDAARRLGRYLLLQFVVNSGYGLLFGIALHFIGVPHPLLWGVLAALLRFVPYIGTLMAAAFPITMAIAVSPGWRPAELAFVAFLVLELAVSNFVEPILYGVHTGISSLAILVAAVFWTTLWGPVGLILSTPLTVCLVVLGRYVPQLKFLEVVLGDEPVLTPVQRFYQRLLATDLEEARSIAEAHLKGNSLENLYETIFIPALRFAEQDYQADALDDDTRRFMFRSTRTLIEELGARLEESPPESVDRRRSSQTLPIRENIACIPARSGPDELIAMMLAQLLRHAGFQARQLKARTVEGTLAAVSQHDYGVAFVSSLPPFAVAQARTLCRRLQISNSNLQVVVGLWDFEGGLDKARERLGSPCAVAVTTTLSDAVNQIAGANSGVSDESLAQPGKS